MTDWPAMFRLGVVDLRLTPDAFWRLSWREWLWLSAPPEQALPLDRRALSDLMTLFPDDEDEQ
ncbi:phage tail assembly chaperone [Asticcacaulis sp. BYS171W]|uniref:Phage tail assembly chaperone n=1 Tax=Asticcacaulis aquaticus TaxID=2984212 RepID=A0ABT5HUF4_9CAUL|nr:phage tail assembly chaperone [Asticcacaulis aquaticus]MDC7683674.1 phage tail assembly chaperone [Asticcacaulis aquaticus]